MCSLFRFSTQEFFICFSCCQNWPLYMNFSIPLVKIDVFLKVPHLSWAWNFVNMYLTHLVTRIQKHSFQIYLKKWFFWIPKHYNPPRAPGGKTISSTLNVMILQMVRNECLRFGVHVGIQVSYKILRLEIPKEVLILYQLHGGQEGLFWGNIDRKHPLSFRS
jgi:hypothetical protein